jgi:hypothetical protein
MKFQKRYTLKQRLRIPLLERSTVTLQPLPYELLIPSS